MTDDEFHELINLICVIVKAKEEGIEGYFTISSNVYQFRYQCMFGSLKLRLEI